MNRKNRRAKGAKEKPDLKPQLRAAMQCLRHGRFGDAEKIYRDIVRQDPSQHPALFNLGLLAHRRSATAEAISFFEKASKIAPNDADTLLSIAVLRAEQSDIAAAHKTAVRALQLRPSAPGLVQLGVMYSETGDNAAALECLAAALESQPENMQAYIALHTLKKFTAEDPDFLRLLDIEKRSSAMGDDDRARLSFVLGKAYLDMDHAEKAFGHLAAANKLRKAAYAAYDISLQEKYVDEVIHLFDAATVAPLRALPDTDTTRPVFIVGMPRSGSTLVDQILSSHPDAYSIGESKILSQCLPVFPNTAFPRLFGPNEPSLSPEMIGKLEPALLQDIARKYLSLTAPLAKGSKKLVDKMLPNYAWTGIIRLALPGAKIIHCTRDPVDIGLSIWRLMFSEHIPWAYDQKDIGRYYLAYKRLMDHWRALFPGEIHEVSYEKLVSNQEAETRKLLEFCGLPWDEGCLKFHENSRQVKTSSLAQVRQPLYKDAVNKGRPYRQFLIPLIDTLAGKP